MIMVIIVNRVDLIYPHLGTCCRCLSVYLYT